MDTLEGGQSYTITRDGRRIGQLVPLQQDRRQRFVTRQEFAGTSRNAAPIDLDAFRADQDDAADHDADSPYDR